MATQNKTKQALLQEIEALRLENEQFKHQSQVFQKAISHHEAYMDRFIDVVYTTDIEGHILYVNQAAKRMLGYSLEDIRGKHMLEVIHADYHDMAMEAHRKTISEGYSAVESVLVDHQGASHHVEVVSVLNEQQGLPIGTQGVVRDITQRKTAEEAVEKNQEMLKALFDAITESVMLIDLNGTIQAVNQTCADRLHLKMSDLVGHDASTFFPGQVYQGRMNKSFEVLASGRPIRFTDERAGLCFDNTIYPVINKQKTIDRLVIFARDITALKEAQNELHVLRNQMAKAERLASAGTLSAMVAHELSQPLTVIRLSVQNALAELAKNRNLELVESDLAHCLESVHQVSSLVDQFRDYARTALDRHRSQVHMNPILNTAIQLTQEACKLAQIHVSVHGMAELPPIVACATDLDQLFFIFLENAFQAADPLKTHTLEITGVATDKLIEIRFADDCGGIAPENEPRLFEPFFTTKPHGSGTGLGLCVAERIVQEIGGRIILENAPNQGATFIIQLPVTHPEST